MFSFSFLVYTGEKKLRSAGGFTYETGEVTYIQIKPIKEYKNLKSKISKYILKKQKNQKYKLKISICLNFTNAFTASLNYPIWINYGINIFTVEKILKNQIIKDDTLLLINENSVGQTNDIMNENDDKKIAYNYAKGYWTVKYLEEKHPGFLKKTFKNSQGKNIEEKISKKLGINTSQKDNLWNQLDEILYNHFKERIESNK